MNRWFVTLVFAWFSTARAYVNRGVGVGLTRSSSLHSSSGEYEFDYRKMDKLPWEDGAYYNTWRFRDSTVNWVASGDRGKPKLVLIHGFGASVYHFRNQLAVLGRDYRVFAFDMVGLGLSDKPLVDYNAELWRDQALAFVEEVVMKEDDKPCVVCGNSLGGFTALYAASSERADKMINGCILLNAAGRFKSSYVEAKDDPTWLSSLKGALQRFVIGLSFVYTKQPARIKQVLQQVYPVNTEEVDDRGSGEYSLSSSRSQCRGGVLQDHQEEWKWSTCVH